MRWVDTLPGLQYHAFGAEMGLQGAEREQEETSKVTATLLGIGA